MSEKNLFIYDGDCPFCSNFAQLIELKSHIPTLKILPKSKPPISDIKQMKIVKKTKNFEEKF